MPIRHVSYLLAGLLFTAGAQAQSTLGDLLDQGARKLSAAEVLALGDVRILRQAADADAFMTLRADGTLVGMVHNKQGHGSSEAVGTWRVDANGRRCADVSLPAFQMTMQQCGYAFRLGGEIFFAASDADRTVTAHLHTGPAFLR